MDKIICDASPLIVLAKADLLELLPNQFSEIVVPQAVVEEILAGPFDDPMRRLISKIEWLKHVRIDPPLSPIGSWQLGRGESEVIEYARLQRHCAVLMDDRAARRAAFAIGIKAYGTLSIIAKAAKQGNVESFHKSVEALKAAGLYLKGNVIETVQKGIHKNRA
jgi:predicted nucleic acid-binding protein